MKSLHKNGKTLKVLTHLENRGQITPLSALSEYGVFRLAAIIHNLRNRGYAISTVDKVAANGTKYAEYRM